MKNKTLKLKPWLRFWVLFVLFLLFSMGLYVYSKNFFFSKIVVPEQNTTYTIFNSVAPIKIKIPSIQVDASIKRVGVTKDGAMDVPKRPEDTGWLETGPSPGAIGSAVIAGHRGWKTGPAVFDDLHKVKVGDLVYIENEEGDERVFIVRKIEVYDAKAEVSEVWNKNDNSYLNLITCSGNWNTFTGTSDERLVVFTDLVS